YTGKESKVIQKEPRREKRGEEEEEVERSKGVKDREKAGHGSVRCAAHLSVPGRACQSLESRAV
ncbi:Uncharacterized protein DAT39_020624, partial [Clarias magur]